MATGARTHLVERGAESHLSATRLGEALPGVLVTLFAALVAVVGWLGIQAFEQGKALARIEGKLDAIQDSLSHHKK